MKQRGRFDELLTVLFMILAIGGVICFFALGSQNSTYIILIGIALVLRIAQYIIRMIK